MGETGCVSWLFERKGYISVQPNDSDADELALVAIDAGADDVKVSKDLVEVYTKVEDLQRIKAVLEGKQISVESAELSWIPKSYIQLDDKATHQNMRMIDALEENDDILAVYSNLEISDAAMASYEDAE
jgi:transcriptional/translational regulatory protein YebC/TACO1